MKRLVIVGGGISGLAAAHGATQAAADRGLEVSVTVLEKDAAVGGKVLTLEEEGGWRIEAGPTGYLDSDERVDVLVEAAGLTKVPANAAAARRFVMRGGQMREIQANPLGFARAGILSPLGLLRMVREPFIGRAPAGSDESVWEFAARRLGREAADRLIAPMVLGVFAGDAKKISLRAAFPLLATLEAEHGSLVRGMIAKKRAGAASGGPSGPRGVLTSFAGGLQALPRALAERGSFEVRCSSPVERLERNGDGWRVWIEGDGEALPADAVIAAGESYAMARLLEPVASPAAVELAALACPPVIVVALGFGPTTLARVPRGFGLLIPRTEGYTSLGCLWDTHLFADRSPDGHLLVRCLLGGATDAGVAERSDEELVLAVRDDLRRMSGIDETPMLVRVVRWPRAIPQYERGHLGRVERVERALAATPGLHVAGNALYGVSFTKSAAHGLETGRAAVGALERSMEAVG